jgi:hypothetical protein
MNSKATYTVAIVGDHHRDALKAQLAHQFRATGLEPYATLDVGEDLPGTAPAVAVVDWRLGDDPEPVWALLEEAHAQGVLVIPVVDSTQVMPEDLPDPLGALNAVGWNDDGDGASRLVRALLRELGIHERQRKVFISHRRSDAAILALDLHDQLRRAGWTPFVDRLGIDEGEAVQAKIDECLDDMAFLILIESPNAHESRWIDHEVLYATDHGMGVLVVNLANSPRVAVAQDIPPFGIEGASLGLDGSQWRVRTEELDAVVAAAEITHAAALARRRRSLVQSTRASAERAGCAVDYLPGWRLRIAFGDRVQILSHLPCLPQPEDLHAVDSLLSPAQTGVVVHHSHAIPEPRRRLLRWMVEHKPIELVPGNAIGGYWQVPS